MNGVSGNTTAVVIYSFISKLFTIDFLNHDFASCLILSVMEDILAHFLTISFFIFLFRLTVDLNTFEFVPTYKRTYFQLLLVQYYHIQN